MQVKDTHKKKSKAVSITKLLAKKFKTLAFTGEWLRAIGVPEANGVWLVWANSGNGKTRFALMLTKYLSKFGKVAYNTLEEGARLTMQKAMIETGFKGAKGINLLNRMLMDDLKTRLRKRTSEKIVIIDSFQYTGMTKKEYIALKEEFPNHLFIFISHAEGKQPAGKVAKFVRYDADVKIRVEGYKAFTTSRYGGGEEIVISEERAARYWGETVKQSGPMSA